MRNVTKAKNSRRKHNHKHQQWRQEEGRKNKGTKNRSLLYFFVLVGIPAGNIIQIKVNSSLNELYTRAGMPLLQKSIKAMCFRLFNSFSFFFVLSLEYGCVCTMHNCPNMAKTLFVHSYSANFWILMCCLFLGSKK